MKGITHKMKKILTLTVIIAIILLIVIGGIFFLKKDKKVEEETVAETEIKDKLASVYEKIEQNENFTFSMEKINGEFEHKISMIQRKNEICIDMHIDGEHTTTIVFENYAYYISHNDKKYEKFEVESVDDNYLDIYKIKQMLEQQYKAGYEEIEGKKYYYEEYDNGDYEFKMQLEIDGNTNCKIRFYFDDEGNLVYIKNIAVDSKSGEDKDEEILKINFSFDINEELFNVPQDYEEIS